MGRSFAVKAPAKINLGLKVIRRRPDGFHELETVMQQVSLADTLFFKPAPGKGRHFFCTERSLAGPENLASRAALLLEQEAGRPLPGVSITLYKNIPVEAGLGGGSSDGAAALAGLNHFWNLGLDKETLQELGLRLGSDVPFCLRGGTALAGGRGEKLEPLPPLPFFWAVLALPRNIKMSTALVYDNFDRSKLGEPSLNELVEAIRQGSRVKILDWMAGDFTNTLETAVVEGVGTLQKTKKKLQEKGLRPVLSGSGPALFILTPDYTRAFTAARMIEEENCRAYLCWTL